MKYCYTNSKKTLTWKNKIVCQAAIAEMFYCGKFAVKNYESNIRHNNKLEQVV